MSCEASLPIQPACAELPSATASPFAECHPVPSPKSAASMPSPACNVGRSDTQGPKSLIQEYHGVEVFAGSGRLTAQLRINGLRDSVAVDHIIPKFCPCPMVKLNLMDDSDTILLFEMISSPFCIFVHVAPPCGTASRARLIQRRPDDPPPCRSDDFPDGFTSGLSVVLSERVRCANHLYELAGRIVRFCVQHHKLVSCENPSRSFMWSTSFWKKHTNDLSLHESVFDHCCYGGLRPKETRLVHNVPTFLLLNLRCPGESSTHRHAPWGRTRSNTFATAEETAYPIPLCKSMAQCIVQELLSRGFQPPPSSLASGCIDPHHSAQTFVGQQPRGKKIAPLVPEFKLVVRVETPTPLLAQVRKLESEFSLPAEASCSPPLSSLPAGSRILRRLAHGESWEESGDAYQSKDVEVSVPCDGQPFPPLPPFPRLHPKDDCNCNPRHENSGKVGKVTLTVTATAPKGASPAGPEAPSRAIPNREGSPLRFRIVVGIPWSPHEFLDKAAAAGHPRHLVEGLPKSLRQTIDFLASTSPHEIGAKRTEAMRFWVLRAKELEPAEARYRAGMATHCQKILASKRLILFKEMLEAAGHSDGDSTGFQPGRPHP